jgi:hypothetical protein
MAIPFLVPAAISIASEFFPVLATKMGGARGREVAHQVIDIAASVAGTPRDAGAREIIASLKSDPSRAQELRLRLEELDSAEHQRIVEDRMDARAYQARIGAQGRLRGTLMLIGVVVGLVVTIGVVAFGGLDAGSNPGALALLTTIAGALLKMLSDAFAFEFGSSAGSKEKTAHIEQMQSALIQAAGERSRAEREEAAMPEPAFVPQPAAPTLATPTPAMPAPAASTPASPAAPRAGTRDFVAELRAMA